MRRSIRNHESLFMVAKLEDFVQADHPLRTIQGLVSDALAQLNGLSNEFYADKRRASIAPEKLIRTQIERIPLRYTMSGTAWSVNFRLELPRRFHSNLTRLIVA